MTYAVVLADQVDFTGWRNAARSLIKAEIAPAEIVWSIGHATDLFALPFVAPIEAGPLSVDRSFADLAQCLVQAREPERFSLLYRILWRLKHGEPHLMSLASDRDIHQALALAKSVRRDRHKMRAFLRFRKVTDAGGDYYAAWFEPDHYIVESNASFFVKRFATMEWFILTPDRSTHWNGRHLSFAEGAKKCHLPADDAMEDYWNTYFTSIFNPTRLKVKAMTAEMPKKYWKNMPEAAAISHLIQSAADRTDAMIDARLAEKSKS